MLENSLKLLPWESAFQKIHSLEPHSISLYNTETKTKHQWMIHKSICFYKLELDVKSQRIVLALELSPLIFLDRDYLPSCTSQGHILQLCKVSSILVHPFRRRKYGCMIVHTNTVYCELYVSYFAGKAVLMSWEPTA